MIIDNNMTEFERDIEISNYSTKKGFELFAECKASEILTENQKQSINVNLCIAYAKRKIESYATTFDHASICIGFGKSDIIAISEIAQELSQSNHNADEYQA
ncbi:MAG: hypothetical protein IJW24_00290 [Clostridia bacterium]|nr:hypothetical protein [Clostridia bacterium]